MPQTNMGAMKRHRSHSLISLLMISLGMFLTLGGLPRAEASIQIPTGLTKTDREETLRILGFGTSSKMLTDPYPLGGYAGFEIGISLENLPTEDLSRLGARLPAPQPEVAFPKFSIGKGLYNDVDLFFHFTPYNRADQISQYGGILRWGFYQASFLPLSASIAAHLNSADVNNQVTATTYGLDLIGGINVSNVALFIGGGPVESSGRFIGGTAGITDSKSLETERVSGFHSMIGANIHISSVFVAVQIDRYTVPVLSGKLGLRF